MAKSSKKRNKIKLVCDASSGFYYVKTKKSNTEKLKLRKYDPVTRTHRIFEEAKISS